MSIHELSLPSATGLLDKPRADAVTWLSLYVALLLLVPAKNVVGPLGSAGAPSMLFGAGSLLLWVLFQLGTPHERGREGQPIRRALAAFVFSVGVTYALAMSGPMDFEEISPADVALLSLASWSGTLLLAHDGVTDRRRLDTLVWRLSVCGALVASLGVGQVLTGQLWVDRLTIPGLTAIEGPGSFERSGFLRPAGTATHPIEFGVVIAMLLPLAIHVGLHHTHRRIVVRWIPAIALAAVVPLSLSRSAYVGAVIGVAICMFGWPARLRLATGGLIAAALVAMPVVTPSLYGSIVGLFSSASKDPSVESRTGSFDLAWEFIVRQPLFGRGLGTFLPKYRIFDNQYLGLLVGIGVVGTVLFLLFGLTAARLLLRFRRSVDDAATRDLSLSLLASITVGFVSLSMFDAFAFPMTMGTLFLVIGLAGALRRVGTSEVGAAPMDDLPDHESLPRSIESYGDRVQ